MNANRPTPNPREPRLGENDPVWRLLAEVPRPEPDGWFATRTLARCRQEMSRAESARLAFSRLRRWALGSGLGLSLAVVVVMTQIHSEQAAPANQKDVQDAFEVVATLNTDTDNASSASAASWQDSSL